MIGRSINNYKILEKLSRKETVGVYKAVDILLSRNVVVKTLEKEVSLRPEVAESFRCEAAILAKLDHSCVPTLHSLTAVDDELFMISEFAEGETLDRILLREGKVSVEKAARIFSQVFDCIEYTHTVGAAHGWLKTSHILLTDAGSVKVLGFGTSENYPSAETIADEKGFETGDYVCSKKASENKVDKENDIYALAAMLYETLTGKSLFDAEKVVGSKIPKAVEAVISQALSPNSAETFQSVSEFRSALMTAGFKISGDKIVAAIQEKSDELQQSAGISAEKPIVKKSDDSFFTVSAVDFSQNENDVSEKEFDQLRSQPNDLISDQPPTFLSGKSGRKRYKIAGAAIFAVLVLHSVWQFSFIQSENLRIAEASVRAIQSEKPLIEVKKVKPTTEAKPVYKAKSSDAVIPAKTVQTVTYRQAEPKPEPPVVRKKAASESNAERLRRAEKLLTGM